MCERKDCDLCAYLASPVVKRVFCEVHERELTEEGQCLACEAERA